MNTRSRLITWGALIGLDFMYLGLIFESRGMKRLGTGLFLSIMAIFVIIGIRRLGMSPSSILRGFIRAAKNTTTLGRRHLKLSRHLILISTIVLLIGTLILSTVLVFPPRVVPIELERRYPRAPVTSDFQAMSDFSVVPDKEPVPAPQEIKNALFSAVRKNITQYASIAQDYIAAIREPDFSLNLTALYQSLVGNDTPRLPEYLARPSIISFDAPSAKIATFISGLNLSDFKSSEVGLVISVPQWFIPDHDTKTLLDALFSLPPHSELSLPLTIMNEFGELSSAWLNLSIAGVIKTVTNPRSLIESGIMFPSEPQETVLLDSLSAFGDLEFTIYVPWNNTPAIESVLTKPILPDDYPIIFKYIYNARLSTPSDLVERQKYDLKFLRTIEKSISSYGTQGTPYYLSIGSPYLNYVSGSQVLFLKLELWLIAFLLGIPLLILSFYLVDFANNLLSKRKRRIIRLLRIRGGSEFHVLVVLLLELLVAGIISGLLALVLVVPAVESSLNVRQLFGFSPAFNLQDYSRYVASLWLIFLGSILLNLHLNSGTLARFVQATISELEEPWENAPSLVQRLNLDVVSAIAGIISGVLLYYNVLSRVPGVLVVFLALIILLGFYGLTFGTVSLLFRWFQKFIVYFSLLLASTIDHLIILSLRNLNLRKVTAARVISLLIIGIITANFFAILGVSIDQTYSTQSMYLRGGEVSLQFSSNAVPKAFLSEFANLEGLQTWTNVTLLDIQNIGVVYAKNSFLLINSSSFFSAVNIARGDLISIQGDSPKEALSKPRGVIISEYEHKEFAYGVGDNFSLRITLPPDLLPPWVNETTTPPDGSYSLKLTVRGVYKYWPIAGRVAVDQFDYSYSLTRNARVADVGVFPDLAFFAQQALAGGFGSSEIIIDAFSYVFGTLDEGADPDAVLNEINALLAKHDLPYVKVFVLNSREGSATIPLVWAMLSLNVLASFVVSGMAVVLFAFITWSDRKQEAGLLKSLGMTQGQLSAMFVLENLSLLVFGIITGILISLYLAFSYVRLFLGFFISGLDLADTGLPVIIDVPWGLIGIGISSIIALGLVSSTIVGTLFSRQPAGDILRVE